MIMSIGIGCAALIAIAVVILLIRGPKKVLKEIEPATDTSQVREAPVYDWMDHDRHYDDSHWRGM